ncbi:chitinase [Aspergillus karnatakaensis]|uniref:chitinase n=1 Tax=Aspergillus karnatakaensis TaxID=1810916 RepID=UPI003CCE4CEE
MFYDFSLYDQVDSTDRKHRIHACSSFGPDFATVDFEIGWWDEGFGLAAPGIRSLVSQIRKYVERGHGTTDRPFIIYSQSGAATIGLYIGQGLLHEGISESALKLFEDNLQNLNVSTPTLAMQLCEPDYTSSHIFGIMATSNGTFTPIQSAIKSWATAACLSFSGSTNITGTAMFTTPLPHSPSITPNSTIHASNVTTSSTIQRSRIAPKSTIQAKLLHRRDECRTIQVEGGNGCAELAAKCGISGADFTKFNPGPNFCSTLKAKQHVCCSSGDLPDFRPQPNDDGSCHAYQAQADDNCDSLSAEYGLTMEDLEDFNQDTWGWNGCDPLYKDTVMCLSKGTPPFPAPIANAVCGLQRPGSKPPTDGSDIAELNPCPLNACCNIWGQCGITQDFCIDTSTGPPGTAAPDTYGCISNCGLDVVKGSGSGEIRIGYYEGYCLSRKCLYQDASQIDGSYTHLHFGFGTLTPDYQVEVGDVLSTYQFHQFKKIKGPKRILSFGGWEFSNSDATYKIFRTGVRPENRLQMATNIANFIKEHDLDGVDIDWEYPGAPDLPEYDPGTLDEGPNYLAFLVVLKNLLPPGKSISIAAPSSYWYLKQFPIKGLSRILDYIVYMTYDLHGQWDAHNSNSQEGCETGNCLRSQVNLTETKQSLAMITKAGVPGEKVVVGVNSYGRSFKMATAGCWGPDCQFTGDRLTSHALKGKCTDTAGYLADAEIAEILSDSSRVVRSFVDPSSHSDILVYDNDEWVGYMSSVTKRTRTNLYASWGLGGTSDWATDLQEYHEPPPPQTKWAAFSASVKSGEDPKIDKSRNGNWTDLTCDDDVVRFPRQKTPSERWRITGANSAWDDIVRIWKETDSGTYNFTESMSNTLGIGELSFCAKTIAASCNPVDCVDRRLSGPGGLFIWNSISQIHVLFKEYDRLLWNAASVLSLQIDDLKNKFAPLPEEDVPLWQEIMSNLLVLGGMGIVGPLFDKLLSQRDWFLQNDRKETTTATVMTILDQTTSVARDLLPGGEPGKWTPGKQDEFSAYMGQVILGWSSYTALGLANLLEEPDDDALAALWNVISDGKLIVGKRDREVSDVGDLGLDMQANILKCVFGFTIPALWRAAGTHAFEMEDYLDADTMKATGECIDDNQYYLVFPEGESERCSCQVNDGGPCNEVCVRGKFAAPPGLKYLDGTNFGGITKRELIRGSLRTWSANSYENSNAYPDASNTDTIKDLLSVDVTTGGYMRIAVCSAASAYQAWDLAKPGGTPFYPCDPAPGRDYCGLATFEDQTSDASPSIEDCRTIIRNIEGNPATKFTHIVGGKPHREILDFGSCHFGVEAAVVNGNADFDVGGQDAIDIINDAISKFGRDGKVGAKGFMNCNGNIKSQAVEWGIY